jgi:hypothetical protein
VISRRRLSRSGESCSVLWLCSEEDDRNGKKVSIVAERFIGYIVSFVVLAAMGWGLPRWFEWRRSLFTGGPRLRKDVPHV